jgi:hypothetical protein
VGDRLHRSLVSHLAASIAVVLVSLQLIPPSLSLEWRWFHLLSFGSIFLAAYLAVLSILREFNKADLLLLLDIVNPRKMIRYIHRELKEE